MRRRAAAVPGRRSDGAFNTLLEMPIHMQNQTQQIQVDKPFNTLLEMHYERNYVLGFGELFAFNTLLEMQDMPGSCK